VYNFIKRKVERDLFSNLLRRRRQSCLPLKLCPPRPPRSPSPQPFFLRVASSSVGRSLLSIIKGRKEEEETPLTPSPPLELPIYRLIHWLAPLPLPTLSRRRRKKRAIRRRRASTEIESPPGRERASEHAAALEKRGHKDASNRVSARQKRNDATHSMAYLSVKAKRQGQVFQCAFDRRYTLIGISKIRSLPHFFHGAAF